MKEKRLWIQGKERAIGATLSLPEGGGPFPFVTMLHGTGSSRDEVFGGYRMLAQELTKLGIACVRFDFAGCGDSPVDYAEYTMAGSLQDTEDVVQWMRSQPVIVPEQLGVVGWSQGGMLAIMAAARIPGVKSLATWACALKMDFYWAEYREAALRDGVVRIDPEWRPPLNVCRAWFEEAAATDAAEYLPAYTGDVLAICGGKDPFGFDRNVEAITGLCRGKRREGWILEGCDHGFNAARDGGVCLRQVARRTAGWFAETLQDRRI